MSSDEMYFLLREDVEKLRQTIDKVQKLRVEAHPDRQSLNGVPSEVYLAVPPCGKGIPAFDYETNTPGYETCCIFRIWIGDDEPTIVPLEAPDGQPVVATVFNLSSRDIDKYPGYLTIYKTKHGQFVLDPSMAEAKAIYTTTTTQDPHATTTPIPCRGECKWIWVEESQAWTLDLTYSSCEEGTSTTTSEPTTTTTGDPSSTTTSTTTTLDLLHRLCCWEPTTTTGDPATSTTEDPSTSTSSTTTTTTTTPNPCHCSQPLFCGKTDGDCTYTSCTSLYEETLCSSTTTADCNTTMNPSCGNCNWVHDGGGWILEHDGCKDPGCDDPNCVCTPPDDGGGGGGGGGCVPECGFQCPGPTGPGLLPGWGCSGACSWVWLSSMGIWSLRNYSCNGGCTCPYPSRGGNSSCEIMMTGCGSSPPDPGEPHDPCRTTSTTSTTPNCESGICMWHWKQQTWQLPDNPCPEDCGCAPPAWEGRDSCEVAVSPCGSDRSTTTSTSTTSTTTTTTECPEQSCQWRCEGWETPLGYVCFRWKKIVECPGQCTGCNYPCEPCGYGTVVTELSFKCDGTEGCDGTEANTQTECAPPSTTTTTTTSSTTTTTTTTVACNPANNNQCVYRCVGGVLVVVEANCISGGICGQAGAGCSPQEEGECMSYDCVPTTCHPCGSGCTVTWTWNGYSWEETSPCGEMCGADAVPCAAPVPSGSGAFVGETRTAIACGEPGCAH